MGEDHFPSYHPSHRPSRGSPSRTCPMLETLAETDYYLLRVDRHCRLLFARRAATPFAKLSDVERCFVEVERILGEIPRDRYLLLVDTRGGPGRNDPGFESVLQLYRGKLLFGFSRNAALAATAAGSLQIQRYARADGRSVLVTDDPQKAFQHLGIPFHPL